ncbi:MAG TPA: avidin/streptavidin family protein [Xanthobacteraceae bacterium]|nr:avidin/streptavidin family protein [Xanthobacteraceae bacterium]
MTRLIAILTFLFLAPAAFAQGLPAPSDWKNQRGSIMHVDFWNPITQQFFGSYTNNAPNYPHCNGKPYRMWGQSDGRKITFTVIWSGLFLEDCQSTTVWTGSVRGNRINTRWVLTRTNGQVYKGQDSFTRQ